jgi:cytoskeletal protein CcmA (bactofilin family)
MKILDGKRVGTVTFEEDGMLMGEVLGDVIVNKGYLELKGKVLGNVLVRGGSCRLTGIVKGNAVNEKGDLEVFGAVHGKVITKVGYTYVNPGASVGGIEKAHIKKEEAAHV